MGWSIGTFSLDGTWVGWGDTEKRGLAWSVGVGWRAPGSYFIQRCHGGAPRGRLVGATGRGRLGQEGAEPPARWGPGGGLGMAQNSPTQGGAPLRAHTRTHSWPTHYCTRAHGRDEWLEGEGSCRLLHAGRLGCPGWKFPCKWFSPFPSFLLDSPFPLPPSRSRPRR